MHGFTSSNPVDLNSTKTLGASRPPRNPGPNWGYRFLFWGDQIVPESIYRPLRGIGTAVAMIFMPSQRRYSREYLTAVTGKPVSLLQIFRHFFALEESLMLKLRVAEGLPHLGDLATDSAEFQSLAETDQPTLLGTFHVGHSDLIGFLIGRQKKRKVSMVRLRVENSYDVERLGEKFEEWVNFIWVNDPANLLFALKGAIADGESVALKCDRVDYSSKTSDFVFLGERRLFPITIYYLSIIFKLPVVLCFGLPNGRGKTIVHSSPVFLPDERSKQENLTRAHEHFQAFLTHLESVLRTNPYIWFNFLPLNPIAP